MALPAQPQRSALEVALAVGFENVSAFTRAFKREVGEPPSSYRRRIGRAPVPVEPPPSAVPGWAQFGNDVLLTGEHPSS